MITLPAFKQSDSSRCGPAAIKMVLAYYGVDQTEDEICKRCNHTYELGCTDLQMKTALESFGFTVEVYNNSSLLDIEYWISRHMPVIVDWFTGGAHPSQGDMPNGHSGVVVGLDRENVYLMDPENAQVRSILREDFVRVWFDWRAPIISSWEDMVIRQAIVAYPTLPVR